MAGLQRAGGDAEPVSLYLDLPLACALIAAIVGSTPLLRRLCAGVADRARGGETAFTIGARAAGTLALAALYLMCCMLMAVRCLKSSIDICVPVAMPLEL